MGTRGCNSCQEESTETDSFKGFVGVEVDFGITSIKADLDRILKNDDNQSGSVLNANDFSTSSTVEKESENSSSQKYSNNSFPGRVPDVSLGFLKCKQVDPIQETEYNSDTLKSSETHNVSYSDCILDKKQTTGSAENHIHLQKLCSKPNNNTNLLPTQNRTDIQTKQDKVQEPNCISSSSCNISVEKSKFNDSSSCSPLVTHDLSAISAISTSNSVVSKPVRRKSGKKNTLCQLLPMQNVVVKTEKILKEWFTLESLCFLFSEGKVKELLAEKSVISKEWQNMCGASAVDSNFYERYLAICRKLNILELEDTKTDASFREETKKPLPDYDALKEEAKELDLKVKMFYKGDKVVRFEETEQSSSNSDNTSVHEPVLPLVDLHAQKAIRRRIVLDKLRRTCQDLQGSLGIKGFNLGEDVRALVSTFKLSAHNVTMKPAEWNLMAIVIIKLISLRDKRLEQGLNNDCSTKHLALLLMSYSLDNGYLDRLICWLTDIDLLIKKE